MLRRIAFIAIAIIMLVTTAIKASGLSERIEIYREVVNIVVDNTPVELEEQPFIHNGRIFVPLRFISIALGKEVEWLPECSTVIITDRHLELPLEECRPDRGETFVYGRISGIDLINYRIDIEQHLDDNSIEIETPLEVNRDVVVILKQAADRNIHFYQVRKGDAGGFILDNSKRVRGIILSR